MSMKPHASFETGTKKGRRKNKKMNRPAMEKGKSKLARGKAARGAPKFV
jgi:hypothetical protein